MYGEPEQTLEVHEGHTLNISLDGETGIASLECDTCGAYILEQLADGTAVWN
jgi:uncharacterized radical SAM superfamily protein